jgi:hypothetical protein
MGQYTLAYNNFTSIQTIVKLPYNTEQVMHNQHCIPICQLAKF